MSMEPARLRESPWRLLKNAAGTPRDLANKLGRLARAVSAYADGASLDGRLERLVRLGYVQTPPSRLQLVIGSVDMLRFWISPAAADYYRSKGIDFGFHQVLRFLDDPASMVDPTGFLSSVDVIVGHVLQVVHANPAYDLQLLESHEDGLEELERQTRAMLEGSHPRQASIGAIVEDPGYHGRLLAYVQAYRDDPDAALAPIRDNVANDPHWARVERTFGTLPAAMRYFAKMPSTPLGVARHLLFVRQFPVQLAEPSA
ncbi:MAG: hypothetical protein KC586_09440 [Myxococcales bacterium]|nr:hypothetical protein [Myxococcales bacterium]